MSSLRNHRVIIASLFLPNTAVLGDSTPPTPDSDTITSLPTFKTAPPSARPSLIPTKSGPLKSIVEDLRDKVCKRYHNWIVIALFGRVHALKFPVTILHPLQRVLTILKSRAVTPIGTPRTENANPFSGGFPGLMATTNAAQSLVGLATAVTRKQHQTTHGPNAQTRVQRRTSRSSGHRQQSRSLSSSRQDSFSHSQPWHIESNPHCNGGLKNAIDSVAGRLRRKLWVGTLGTNTNGLKESLKRNMEWRMREECESLPVWIPDSEFASCYDEFCHQVLWPCLHYAIPDAPKTKSFYESASFKQYVAVNQRFADAIVATYQDGDIIWVNDYHLMLLPQMLRAKLPSASIGFFMHVAFPSSEIFRCLSVRNDLLQGVLGADLIGFQTANYARHFRQTVSRILSAEALPKGIQLENRFVDVGVFPMGIDLNTLTEKRFVNELSGFEIAANRLCRRDPEVAEWVESLRQRYAGMKLIVGRDKLDEVQVCFLKSYI